MEVNTDPEDWCTGEQTLPPPTVLNPFPVSALDKHLSTHI